ncbi:MAG: PKD domain-containing protein, partial [bacterium]
DVASATGNTYFTDRVANTALVTNADAYYSPGALITTAGTANTFPYKRLVDEAADNRTGVSNGGNPDGNFGADGWTRTELGTNKDGWTGGGVWHQGQTAGNVIALDKTAVAAAPFSLDVAVVAKYNDPRQGANATEKKAHRLPPATPDMTVFGYRMPHCSLDVEAVSFDSTSADFAPNAPSASILTFHVVDFDARATETTQVDLKDELDPTMVAIGEAGLPDFAVCIPGVLGDATFVDDWDPTTDVADDDTASGGDATPDSGKPADALCYTKSVSKVAGSGQTAGSYTGMARATDPEIANITDPFFVIELSGALAPLTTNIPTPISYQAFSVGMAAACTPPSAGIVSPSGTVGCAADPGVSFSVAYTGSPAVGYSWVFGGGAIPNTSTAPSPSVTLGAPGTYNGTVTVDNACGAPVVFNFSFTISSPWSRHLIDQDMVNTGRGWQSTAIIYNGNPMVIGMDVSATNTIQPRVSFATVPNPTSAAQWNSYFTTALPTTLALGVNGSYPTAHVVGGRLLILYKGDTNGLVCQVANASPTVPAAQTDWGAPYSVSGALSTAFHHGACISNGELIVTYRDGVNSDLYMQRATVNPPLVPANWTAPFIAHATPDLVGLYSEPVVHDNGIDTRVAVLYRNSTANTLLFTRATTSPPSNLAFTPPVIVDSDTPASGSQLGLYLDVETVPTGAGPRLAVVHSSGTGAPAGSVSYVRYAIANVQNPLAPADWTKFQLRPGIASGGNIFQPDMMIWNGKLVVGFTETQVAANTGEAWIARANTTTPNSLASFDFSLVDNTVNASVGVSANGAFCNMLQLGNGDLAMTYRFGQNYTVGGACVEFAHRDCPLP